MNDYAVILAKYGDGLPHPWRRMDWDAVRGGPLVPRCNCDASRHPHDHVERFHIFRLLSFGAARLWLEHQLFARYATPPRKPRMNSGYMWNLTGSL